MLSNTRVPTFLGGGWGVAYSRGAYLIFDCFRGALIREMALIRINTLNKQRIFSLFQDY